MKHFAYLLLAAISLLGASAKPAISENRPRYGGTLRVMMQSTPAALAIPASSSPVDYWDAARTLSMIGDTLVTLDVRDHPQPALAVTWQSDSSNSHWQFTLRRGVKFHDGSAATPAVVAQILGAIHPNWKVRASADSVLIDSEAPIPSLLAELALPRNLVLKRSGNGLPIGTGPFLVSEWQPGKLLRLTANEGSWAGRPFVDAIEIEFGKSLRDQATALELDRVDVIESVPQAGSGSQGRSTASSSSPLLLPVQSLPVELMALVFSSTSKAQDPRFREALALAINRKPIQSVLLKGVGDPAASILPKWMTGYSELFSTQVNTQRARAVLADSRQPMLNLSYDPRDPQAQLIAERIALNAREIGVTVQVSLSGAEDIRLMRVVLPSPDPAMSLVEAARQLGLRPPELPAPRENSIDDLYQSERSLLAGYAVIPLFHLPIAAATNARVRDWQPDQMGRWNEAGHALAELWLAEHRSVDNRPVDSTPDPQPEAAPR
jgi:ABC-type transport system substrate-binding protein